MSWLGAKKSAGKQGSVMIALESVSTDILAAQLQGLEAELTTAGLPVRRLEFPSSSAESNIPGLVGTPELLRSEEAVGLVAALDRAKVFTEILAEASARGEVVLLCGSALNTAAWLASGIAENAERVALYKWLDGLECNVFAQKRLDLVLLLDCLPEHIDLQEGFVAPVGWGNRSAPEVVTLRDCYVEAAKLFPNTKIVNCFRDGLLKPDSDIQNEIWNLVRRIALKSNVPPRV